MAPTKSGALPESGARSHPPTRSWALSFIFSEISSEFHPLTMMAINHAADGMALAVANHEPAVRPAMPRAIPPQAVGTAIALANYGPQ